jgi:uncharacterized protein with gpF-like domain
MPLIASPETLSLDNAKLPFEEQIAFFKGKAGLHIPTQHFDDIATEEHEHAFVVANAQKADLLADFYHAVETAIADGQSIDWFRKQFDAIQAKHGWVHTGDASFRTRTIYDTNMTTSYARGRDAQLADPDLRAVRPYLEYNIGPAEHHRVIHQSWAGTTLRYDDPWIEAHRPVKAWGCHCWLRAVRNPTPGRDTAPKESTYEVTDRHGVPHTIPMGVDYGFHTDGWKPDLRDYPKPIAADLKAALKRGDDA